MPITRSQKLKSIGIAITENKSDDQIIELIEAGADVNAVYENVPVLLLALNRDRIAIANKIIKAGGNPNVRGYDDKTPLMYLSIIYNKSKSKVDVVSLVYTLAEAGGDLNASDKSKYNYTPLLWAIEERAYPILSALLKVGANVNKADEYDITPLMRAIRSEPFDIIDEIIKAGADINKQDKFGRTAFQMAVHPRSNIILAKRLKDAGADMNIPDKSIGDTPLITAIRGYNESMTKWLITAGVDVNKASKNGTTPLLWAIPQLETVELLLKAGANPNTIGLYEKTIITPLIYAIKSGYLSITKELIKHGADIEMPDKDGYTPILYAIWKVKINAAFLTELIKAGVNVNSRVKTSDIEITPLMFAATDGILEAIKILVEAGADVNTLTNQRASALYYAAKYGYLNIVKYLLDLPQTNKDLVLVQGKTLLDHAKEGMFSKKINKIIIRAYGEKVDEPMWKGMSRSDIQNLDEIFTNPGNCSVCPICLAYVVRERGCLYMHHNCKGQGNYYHEELYIKYNNKGNIEWCTSCGRISGEHSHYRRVSAEAPKPYYENKKYTDENQPGYFDSDCRRREGGGGPPENMARFRKLREIVLELQEKIGDVSHDDAMDTLVEEVWNAPLKMNEPLIKEKLEKIEREKVWNIPLERFKENTSIIENEVDPSKLPNVRRPASNANLKPNILNEGMNFMMEEGPLIQFQHRQEDGTINKHKDVEITVASLIGFLENQVKNFGTEEFGYCYMFTDSDHPCKSLLYPEEIKEFVPEELYNEYRMKFNRKFQGRRRGGRMTRLKKKHTRKTRRQGGANTILKPKIIQGATNIFREAINAQCFIGRGKNNNKTRKNNKNYIK